MNVLAEILDIAEIIVRCNRLIVVIQVADDYVGNLMGLVVALKVESGSVLAVDADIVEDEIPNAAADGTALGVLGVVGDVETNGPGQIVGIQIFIGLFLRLFEPRHTLSA